MGLDNAVCRQVLCPMNHIYRDIFQFLCCPRQGAAVHPPQMNILVAQGGLQPLPTRCVPPGANPVKISKSLEKRVALGLP